MGVQYTRADRPPWGGTRPGRSAPGTISPPGPLDLGADAIGEEGAHGPGSPLRRRERRRRRAGRRDGAALDRALDPRRPPPPAPPRAGRIRRRAAGARGRPARPRGAL